ncbi:MAG: hypothetical protein K8I30_13175 [Anaerolineae bacterium]|nr:hypothetical protein [Anaerolineae bacterium]
MLRRLLFALFIFTGIYGTILAQGSGQMCVRSFEDRNGNGQLDAGEPLLTRGVGVNLLNGQGVTIASSLLDTSPTAAQGVICFQFLPAGQYSVVITSADYTATTPDTITTTIADGGLPTVVEFGAKLSAAPTAAASTTDDTQPDGTRIVLSGVGTLLVIGLMAFLGIIVYWFAFGRRPPQDVRRTTSTMRAVRETGEMRRTVETTRTRDTGTTHHLPDDADERFRIPDDPQ